MHRRLGHINHRYLNAFQKMVTGLDLDLESEEICEPCCLAKSHRITFESFDYHASRIGELAHADVCYVPQLTLFGNYKYFLCFLDDYSRFITVYLLKNKSDTAAAF
jgi:hypothetical protein